MTTDDRAAQARAYEQRLILIANEFGRVRNLLTKRVGAGNSPCAARRALYSLRRGELDRALGYCETAVNRDAEWQRFADMVRAEVDRARADMRAVVAQAKLAADASRE